MSRHLWRVAVGAACAALSTSFSPALADGARTVLTPRGAPISVIADFPEGSGPFPAVVLAPGTGTLRQKINDVVAKALEDHGFAVYRFEWAYYLKDPNRLPSDSDRRPEMEDLTTVVALAKADKRVDPTSILLGGKSRGTIIAWRVLREDPSLRGAIQLTPVCTKTGFTPETLYPGVATELRPSLWISGDADPACRAATFYHFIAEAGASARAAGLRGDHSLSSDAASGLAAALAVDFAQGVIGRPAEGAR